MALAGQRGCWVLGAPLTFRTAGPATCPSGCTRSRRRGPCGRGHSAPEPPLRRVAQKQWPYRGPRFFAAPFAHGHAGGGRWGRTTHLRESHSGGSALPAAPHAASRAQQLTSRPWEARSPRPRFSTRICGGDMGSDSCSTAVSSTVRTCRSDIMVAAASWRAGLGVAIPPGRNGDCVKQPHNGQHNTHVSMCTAAEGGVGRQVFNAARDGCNDALARRRPGGAKHHITAHAPVWLPASHSP